MFVFFGLTPYKLSSEPYANPLRELSVRTVYADATNVNVSFANKNNSLKYGIHQRHGGHARHDKGKKQLLVLMSLAETYGVQCMVKRYFYSASSLGQKQKLKMHDRLIACLFRE